MGSFKTPILHFVGRPLSSSDSSLASSWAFEAEFRAKNERGRSEEGVNRAGLSCSASVCIFADCPAGEGEAPIQQVLLGKLRSSRTSQYMQTPLERNLSNSLEQWFVGFNRDDGC